MSNSSNGWNDWSKVVLKELERLNNHYEIIDDKMSEIRNELTKVKTVWKSIDTLNEWKKSVDDKAIIKTVEELKIWKDKIDEIWSPTQMGDIKVKVENQASKWTVLITIWAVIQFLVVLFSVYVKLK